jgi:hypothetical protein
VSCCRYRRGTDVPQPRQVSAPRWIGLRHLGQTRNPASERGEDSSRGLPLTGVGCSSECDWRAIQLRDHRSRSATCSGERSTVPDSGWLFGSARAAVPAGTGTIRPQPGHLPCAGGLAAGTFNFEPHGQKNRRNPSVGMAALRRRRTLAPHFGHNTRSPLVGTGSVCPHRQVAFGMGYPDRAGPTERVDGAVWFRPRRRPLASSLPAAPGRSNCPSEIPRGRG